MKENTIVNTKGNKAASRKRLITFCWGFIFITTGLIFMQGLSISRPVMLSMDSAEMEVDLWPIPVEAVLKLHPSYETYIKNEDYLEKLAVEFKKPITLFSFEMLTEMKNNLEEQENILRQYTLDFSNAEKKFMAAEKDFFSRKGRKEYLIALAEVNNKIQDELSGIIIQTKERQIEKIKNCLAKLDHTYGTLILQINLNLVLFANSEERKVQLEEEKENLLQEWANARNELQALLTNQLNLEIRQQAKEYQTKFTQEKERLLNEINQLVASSLKKIEQKGRIRIKAQSRLGEIVSQKRKVQLTSGQDDNLSLEKVILALRESQERIYSRIISDLEMQIKKYGYTGIRQKLGDYE